MGEAVTFALGLLLSLIEGSILLFDQSTLVPLNMPDVESKIDFLSDLPLYNVEKPFLVLPLAGTSVNPESYRITNIELEAKPVLIKDIRGKDLSSSKNGFQIVQHTSKNLKFDGLESLKVHKKETEDLLSDVFPMRSVLSHGIFE